ncbi:hypothetical protein P280DRAFT_506890 [Massarina eburnea CBS 473.64]|uniref:BTB domain-containing protein n=1 Tax=Massarina eburnea CBS 473.64 TaxID=1395130 RepID=A0A6A6S3N3_9PLEO|nr:hypothetical protein P280DRAFT_506890 [Massarina eburnea CBS 473.64]
MPATPEDRVEALRSDIVEVSVGPNSQIFRTHRDILSATSPFLKDALRADSTSVTLPNETPIDFELYDHWLYFHTLPARAINLDVRAKQDALLRAYLFGARFVDILYKNFIITSVIETFHKKYPTANQVKLVYEQLPPHSPMRRLFADSYVYGGAKDDSWAKTVEQCPRDFLIDVTMGLMGRKAPEKKACPWLVDKGKYLEDVTNA